MRPSPCVLLVTLALGLPGLVAGEDQDEIGKVVADLGHDEPAVREEASRVLVFYRERAVAALTAALQSPDTEVRVRAQQALDDIALDRKIGPSAWVRLPEGESSVEALLREIARQGGRTIDRGEVVLDGKSYDGPRGWMAIWEAIDRLTRAADCRYAMRFSRCIRLMAGPAPTTPVVYDGRIRIDVLGALDLSPRGVHWCKTRGLPPRPSMLRVAVRWEPGIAVLAELESRELVLESDERRSLRVDPSSYELFGFAGLDHDSGDDCEGVHTIVLRVPLKTSRQELPAHSRLHGALRLLSVLDASEEVLEESVRLNERGFLPVQFEVTTYAPTPVGIDFPTDRCFLGFETHVLRSGDRRHCPLSFVCSAGGATHMTCYYLGQPVGPPPYSLFRRVATRVAPRRVEVDLRDLNLR